MKYIAELTELEAIIGLAADQANVRPDINDITMVGKEFIVVGEVRYDIAFVEAAIKSDLSTAKVVKIQSIEPVSGDDGSQAWQIVFTLQ